MDYQAILDRILSTVDQDAYLTPISHIDPEQRTVFAVAVTGVNTPAGRDNLRSFEIAELSGAHVDGPVGVTAPTLDTYLQSGAAAQ